MKLSLLRLFIFKACLGFAYLSFGQEIHIAPFDGTVYKLPVGKSYWKFSDSYADFPVIKTIQWDKINVPSRDVDDGFPDIERQGAFAIMFTSKANVTESAMFRFVLNSDDGTILWIDDKLVINNDTHGAMHAKTDTIALTKGMHDIRIWYIQAFPTKYGVIFDGEHVDIPLEFDYEEIVFENKIFFDVDSYRIMQGGELALDTLVQKLNNYPKVKINIEGHTDSIGSYDYNLSLSEKRAKRIKKYLESKISNQDIMIDYVGKGSAFPIAENNTKEGRAQNRRVKIVIMPIDN